MIELALFVFGLMILVIGLILYLITRAPYDVGAVLMMINLSWGSFIAAAVAHYLGY